LSTLLARIYLKDSSQKVMNAKMVGESVIEVKEALRASDNKQCPVVSR